jgi:Sec7-like guanine-nucleotide exchange factor
MKIENLDYFTEIADEKAAALNGSSLYFDLPSPHAPASVSPTDVAGSISEFQQAAEYATTQSLAVAIKMTIINGIKGAITKKINGIKGAITKISPG